MFSEVRVWQRGPLTTWEAVCSEACFSPEGLDHIREGWGGKTFCSLEAFVTWLEMAKIKLRFKWTKSAIDVWFCLWMLVVVIQSGRVSDGYGRQKPLRAMSPKLLLRKITKFYLKFWEHSLWNDPKVCDHKCSASKSRKSSMYWWIISANYYIKPNKRCGEKTILTLNFKQRIELLKNEVVSPV